MGVGKAAVLLSATAAPQGPQKLTHAMSSAVHLLSLLCDIHGNAQRFVYCAVRIGLPNGVPAGMQILWHTGSVVRAYPSCARKQWGGALEQFHGSLC
eukprot:SAG31_NODE_1297_length_8934_cov_26.567176_3_plen_97_part_00